MSKIKYGNYLALALIAFLFTGSSGFALVSTGASCNLTTVRIAGGTLSANTEQVIITATPSCWSGSVAVNQGNQDTHVITVTVTAGHGTGIVQRQEITGPCAQYCIHPYATNPGMRGNNIMVPAN